MLEAAIQFGSVFLFLNILVLALIVARRLKLAAVACVLSVIVIVFVSAFPFGAYLIRPLEDYYPAMTAYPEQVDGIVVLGGAIDPVISADRRQLALNGAAERMFALAQLSRQYPRAGLVFTGGSGDPFNQWAKEGTYVPVFMRELGTDVGRLIVEDQSRTTFENAVMTYDLIKPTKSQRWLLVTSAVHMPRAAAVFCRAGWNIIPFPVDYHTRQQGGGGGRWDLAGGIGAFSMGAHEWLGLLYYRFRGWTGELLPDRSVCGKNPMMH